MKMPTPTRRGASLPIASLLCTLSACGQLSKDPAPADHEETTSPQANDEPPPSPPAQVPECNGQPCAPPNECVLYAGIAGPQVPLYACGIPCGANDTCPSDMVCRVIADGPRLCQGNPPP